MNREYIDFFNSYNEGYRNELLDTKFGNLYDELHISDGDRTIDNLSLKWLSRKYHDPKNLKMESTNPALTSLAANIYEYRNLLDNESLNRDELLTLGRHLAEAFVRKDEELHPDVYAHRVESSELGKGEVFSREVQYAYDTITGVDENRLELYFYKPLQKYFGRDELSEAIDDLILDEDGFIDYEANGITGEEDELELFAHSSDRPAREHEDFSYSEDEIESMRKYNEMILEREGFPVDTPRDRLPWYVSNELYDVPDEEESISMDAKDTAWFDYSQDMKYDNEEEKEKSAEKTVEDEPAPESTEDKDFVPKKRDGIELKDVSDEELFSERGLR